MRIVCHRPQTTFQTNGSSKRGKATIGRSETVLWACTMSPSSLQGASASHYLSLSPFPVQPSSHVALPGCLRA